MLRLPFGQLAPEEGTHTCEAARRTNGAKAEKIGPGRKTIENWMSE